MYHGELSILTEIQILSHFFCTQLLKTTPPVMFGYEKFYYHFNSCLLFFFKQLVIYVFRRHCTFIFYETVLSCIGLSAWLSTFSGERVERWKTQFQNRWSPNMRVAFNSLHARLRAEAIFQCDILFRWHNLSCQYAEACIAIIHPPLRSGVMVTSQADIYMFTYFFPCLFAPLRCG